jgi:4,5-dihydroxyphthalate decarboxylase
MAIFGVIAAAILAMMVGQQEGIAMLTKPDRLKLFTLMGSYPNVMALKDGKINSDLLEFDFADVKVSNTAFKPLVREARFDLAEVAIVTFLQAKYYGKPYVLIPATVVGRGQLHTIAYNPERGHLGPGDLGGKTVGVRAYTQTTGVWVRGILAQDYGVDLGSIDWVTFEEGHVAEYTDPPNVRRAPQGKGLVQMLLDGEIDAAIVGDKFPDPRLKPLIANPETANRTWSQAHGGVPINHMLVIRAQLAQSRPDVVREVYRVFREAKEASFAESGTPELDPFRFGIEPNRRSLEIVIDFAVKQGLMPRRFAVDELFSESMRALG